MMPFQQPASTLPPDIQRAMAIRRALDGQAAAQAMQRDPNSLINSDLHGADWLRAFMEQQGIASTPPVQGPSMPPSPEVLQRIAMRGGGMPVGGGPLHPGYQAPPMDPQALLQQQANRESFQRQPHAPQLSLMGAAAPPPDTGRGTLTPEALAASQAKIDAFNAGPRPQSKLGNKRIKVQDAAKKAGENWVASEAVAPLVPVVDTMVKSDFDFLEAQGVDFKSLAEDHPVRLAKEAADAKAEQRQNIKLKLRDDKLAIRQRHAQGLETSNLANMKAAYETGDPAAIKLARDSIHFGEAQAQAIRAEEAERAAAEARQAAADALERFKATTMKEAEVEPRVIEAANLLEAKRQEEDAARQRLDAQLAAQKEEGAANRANEKEISADRNAAQLADTKLKIGLDNEAKNPNIVEHTMASGGTDEAGNPIARVSTKRGVAALSRDGMDGSATAFQLNQIAGNYDKEGLDIGDRIRRQYQYLQAAGYEDPAGTLRAFLNEDEPAIQEALSGTDSKVFDENDPVALVFPEQKARIANNVQNTVFGTNPMTAGPYWTGKILGPDLAIGANPMTAAPYWLYQLFNR